MIPSEIESIPEADWEDLATKVGRPVGELKRDLLAALESLDKPSGHFNVAPKLAKKGYEFPVIPGVLAFKVSETHTGGDDWKADVTFTILTFGAEVYSQEFPEFSKEKKVVRIKPESFLFHVDLELGFYGEKCCFGFSGDVKVMGFEEKPVKIENVFCIY